jgi:signal transduction histidine kinase
MKLIQNSAQRCVQIVKDMLALARQQEAERRPANLNALVAKCVALKQFDWVGSDVDVEESYDLALAPVTISDPQIQQVVFNLLTNAEQAIRASEIGKGRIKVSTASANGLARITVEDNGPGIPKETLQKIGEPFFTTKPAGIGTGLGVSISKRIVEAHGGKLLIESDPGRRTVFTIELPKES